MFKVNLVFLLIAICFAGIETAAQETQGEKKTLLELSISTDKSAYVLDETIKAMVEIKNQGDIPVYIYRIKGHIDHIYFNLHNSQGLVDAERDSIHPPLVRMMNIDVSKKDFIEIKPHESIKENFQVSLASLGANENGEYLLDATYWSFFLEARIPNELKDKTVFTFENDQVSSPRIKITATPGCTTS